MSFLVKGGITQLILFFIIVIPFAYYLYLMRKGKKLPEMRDFPPLKALDDGIDRCLEMGRPFLYVMGMMATVRGEFAGGVIAVLSLLRVLARRCFEKNVRVIVVPGGAADETVPMLDTLLKESALEIGKPEMYKTERDLVYLGRAYSAELVNLIEVEKPGCTANVGVIGGPDMIAWEPVHRNDSLLIGGTHRLVQCGCVAVAADYALICDEVYAACAAASGNKDLISTALSGDLAKYVLIAICIIGIILGFMGMDVTKIFGV